VTGERPAVVLALTPVAERAIEPWLFGDQAAVAPVGSVSEADELDRDASTPGVRAVLISPGLSGLTTAHLERARAHGLRLVGVALDEHDEQALSALGVEAIIDADQPADALLAGLRDEEPLAPSPPLPPPSSSEPAQDRGTLLAVVGTRGAPGASECAASLALLASRRWPTTLVELDLLGGGLDVRIGADPHAGSIVGLVRAATAGEQPLAELVERWVTKVPGWPPVLLAPADPEGAFAELTRPGAIAAALHALQSRVPLAVCDVGALLATGDTIAAPARAHREALVTADAVLLVLGARDAHIRPGLAQLDRLLNDLGIPAERLRIVINGVGGPGAASERQLDDTLVPRLAERGLAADAWLAFDQRALDCARRKGVPLAAARSHGRYARVLTHLLDELFLPSAPAPRRRKHRLSAPTAPIEDAREEVAIPWRS
jgi:Flp pilus assembly CpaE family ATPase